MITTKRKNTISNALSMLKKYKEAVGSWQKVANVLGTSRRTVLRWRLTKRISPVYIRLINEKIYPLIPAQL